MTPPPPKKKEKKKKKKKKKKKTLNICARNVNILYYKWDLLNKANTSDQEDAFLDLHCFNF